MRVYRWAIILGLWWAWSTGAASPARYPYRGVGTTGMVADIVRNVAGEQARVDLIVGEGLDPHQYTPTRGDVLLFQQADIIFYNGLLLEGRMGDILARMQRRGKPVHAVAEAVVNQFDYSLRDEDGEDDPHLWMDVQAWMKAVEVVTAALAAFDPDHAALYQQRAATYRDQLQALDQYARDVLQSIPSAYRVLVTAHDAFGYLGRAYDVEVRGIQGISTDSEAGLRDIENLVRFLVDRELPAIFVETSVADRNVRALIEGARARGHTVVIGGELFSDAMGPPGSYEGTYIGMIDHNVTTIARALGGEAPERGWQGKLQRR